ncbi:MAG: hypothetical protein O7C68_04840 [Rickettsia endosymbiont of Ixodes ricinus]|uniref:hypothetical protein n=1 Tax=Rickettsia helvetica TaxID=35789 RepID=UPI001E2FF9A8|nr:hypothetical protein [Rickettsia helvetica]MCZ6883780.1 hypothetical protein [Rickettsia endosymbiont of Ixodes ricinus]MCZ6896902.1 hypothetical protein [Rickettsia endosymbiont of Ixodes ricinus]
MVEVKEYRDITFPDIMDGSTNLQLVLYESNGSRPEKTNASYLKLDYTDDGRIIKLSLPNPPVLSSKPLYPACIIYHSKLYTLSVNSEHYEHLTRKIYENNGVVEIGHADPAYHIEAIYG